MRRVEFRKSRRINIKGFGKVFKNYLRTLLILAVIANTYNYHRLVTATHDKVLIRQVMSNGNELRELENKFMSQGASVKELEFNPKDLMEANVVIYTDKAKGSGSIIKVTDDSSYVLTAAHVVTTKVYERNSEGKLEKISKIDKVINIHYGKNFKKKARAVVQKINHDLDVAVLKVYKKLKIKPIKIAETSPELGETVWSISNPGSQEGVINKGIFSDVASDYSYVSVGGYFGSSGGMVLNNKGEQIGVISTVLIATIAGYDLSITVYNGITITSNLNKFLKGLI